MNRMLTWYAYSNTQDMFVHHCNLNIINIIYNRQILNRGSHLFHDNTNKKLRSILHYQTRNNDRTVMILRVQHKYRNSECKQARGMQDDSKLVLCARVRESIFVWMCTVWWQRINALCALVRTLAKVSTYRAGVHFAIWAAATTGAGVVGCVPPMERWAH